MGEGLHRRQLLAGAAVAAAAGGAVRAWAQSPFTAPVTAPAATAPVLKPGRFDLAARRFVASRHRHAVWSDANAEALLTTLQGAGRHGVDASLALQDIRAADGRRRDLPLTRAALAYASALGRGLADPHVVFDVYTVRTATCDPVAGLAAALRTSDVPGWLDASAPQDPEYAKLSDAYLAKVAAIGVETSPQIPDGPAIRPGDADPRIPAIAAALGAPVPAAGPALQPTAMSTTPAEATNGAPAPESTPATPQSPAAPTSPAAGAPSSPPGAVPAADVLTPELAAAVEAFQRRHGIRADGVIGAETLHELNAGPADRARQLALNLERRRWLPRAPAPDRIDVNIAAARLQYFRDGEVAWTTNVAVGRTDDQTPDIQAAFDELVVNPPWRVPSDIVAKEIRPKGRGYMASQHMRWTSHGVVQAPGPWAALGLVKFDLHDPYDIYLHDTPVKGVFDDSARDLSHGCVRVQDAVAFARRLADADGRADRFDTALASGRTEVVPLKTTITVRLLYHTAFVDTDGSVQFRPDAYGRDDVLAAALGMAAALPEAPADDVAPVAT